MDLEKLLAMNSASAIRSISEAERVSGLARVQTEVERISRSLDRHTTSLVARFAAESREHDAIKRITDGISAHSALRALNMATKFEEQLKIADRFSSARQASEVSTTRYLSDIASQQALLERFSGITKMPSYLTNVLGGHTADIHRKALESLTAVNTASRFVDLHYPHHLMGQQYADAISDLVRAPSRALEAEKYLTQVSLASSLIPAATDYAKLLSGSHAAQYAHDLERYAARPALVHMENLLRAGEPFSFSASKVFRQTLGDWRDPPQAESFAADRNPIQFYGERGFDAGLIETPDSIFYDELEDAGLDSTSLDLELYGPLIVPKKESLITAMQRNAACYQRMFQLETRLRQFIAEAMLAHFGPQWFKRLPEDVCIALKVVKTKKGGADELDERDLKHTDFTHYEKVICRRDLWRDIFSAKFKTNRIEDVRESFIRLKFVRDTTMHCNSVSKEDLLTTITEGRRILSAIGWPNMH